MAESKIVNWRYETDPADQIRRAILVHESNSWHITEFANNQNRYARTVILNICIAPGLKPCYVVVSETDNGYVKHQTMTDELRKNININTLDAVVKFIG